MGAELGHVSVSIDGPRCHCGSVGCVEAYCSAWALNDAIDLLISAQRGDAIVAAADGQKVGPQALGRAAERGDQNAIAVLTRAGTALGVGLANFVNIFNPEIIAIGGGLADIGEPLLQPARNALSAWAMPMMGANVQVVRSQLGSRTGIYGAAALVFRHDERLRFASVADGSVS
jgi:glucokinase